MLGDIGLMVCVTGLVICLYVAARSLEISRRDAVKRWLSVVHVVVAVVSLLGAVAMGFVGYMIVRPPAPSTPEEAQASPTRFPVNRNRPYFDENGRYVVPDAGPR